MKIEQLIGKRSAERKELELVQSRVDELSQEQKSSRETIGRLSAQRDELQRLCSQHSDDLSALRMVSRWCESHNSAFVKKYAE